MAEEGEQVNPALVARDADAKVYTVRYDAVNAMLLNEFLKEHRKVLELEATVVQQRKDFEATPEQQQKEFESKIAHHQKKIEQFRSEENRSVSDSQKFVISSGSNPTAGSAPDLGVFRAWKTSAIGRALLYLSQ